MSLFISFFLSGLKSLRLRCFKSDRDEIWQDCSSSKYTSIDSRILDITSYCQDDGNDVQLPLAAAYVAYAAVRWPAEHVFTFPEPYYIRTCCFT